ncbi:MAG: hypothetical protein IPN84_02900 [Sphingomonadales bacterium]|jgi:hypothetical protein|nr:hypothetical protein [Sphingomonadales bacterium]
MHILAMFFFVAVAAFAVRVVTDILGEDGDRMWAALMGRSVVDMPFLVEAPASAGEARVVPLRGVRPQCALVLPLAA